MALGNAGGSQPSPPQSPLSFGSFSELLLPGMTAHTLVTERTACFSASCGAAGCLCVDLGAVAEQLGLSVNLLSVVGFFQASWAEGAQAKGPLNPWLWGSPLRHRRWGNDSAS